MTALLIIILLIAAVSIIGLVLTLGGSKDNNEDMQSPCKDCKRPTCCGCPYFTIIDDQFRDGTVL